MSHRTDFTDIPPPLHRQSLVWRALVAFQVVMVVAIVATLVTILVVGNIGSLFVQHSP